MWVFFTFRASAALVADLEAKRVLTSCVGTVSPASEVVLQQLVRPCGTSPGHQPHGGLVEEHLAAERRSVVSGYFDFRTTWKPLRGELQFYTSSFSDCNTGV